MTVQMPGTTGSEEGRAASEPVQKVSKLPNGIRVASETSHGLGTSMAIFLQLGSVDETPETSGATHFLQHLSFKATEKRSHFMLTRAIEKLGGHVASGASRDGITYAGECLSSNAEGLFALMAEAALYPRTEDLDITLASQLVSQDIANSAKNGSARVLDALHEVAFNGAGLGAPLLSAREHIDGAVVKKFLTGNLSPARIVVAGVGIDHERLVAMTADAFGHLPAGGALAQPASQYIGGDYRIPAALDKGEVHFTLGFQGAGVKDKNMLAAAALQTLLGGGDSFSAGGPGKGLTSRLFTNVLCDAGVLSSSAFSVSYQDTGLFGIQTSVSPESAADAVSLVCKELVRLRKQPVSAEELARAVNQTRSSLLMNLEAKGIVCEDLGRQVIYYGERVSGAKLSQQLQALTAQDLSRAAEAILASPLSVAAYGNVSALPPYDHIKALLA